MSQFRLARLSLILAAIGLTVAPAMTGLSSAYAADPAPAAAAKPDAVRPEIYKLLDPAQIRDLMAAKNYTEIQNRLNQVDAIADKSPYETFVLNRNRVVLGSATKNNALMIPALIAVIDTGRLDPAQQKDFLRVLAGTYYAAADYDNAIVWLLRYQKDTGDMTGVRPTLLRSYFLKGDYATTKVEALKDIDAAQKAGKKPSAETLQLLASVGIKGKDDAAYLQSVELSVQYYPTDAYWSHLLSKSQGKSYYAARLSLDTRRLQMVAVKTLVVEDYTDVAELALQGGFYTEAKKAMDAADKAGLLGKGDAKEIAEQKKLRASADKGAADDAKNIGAGEAPAMKSKDGIGLVNLGYAYVTMDQFDKGIDLIQKGIAKGVAKNPEDAKLRLGEAYALAGRKDDAIKTLQAVNPADGRGDLARYWIYWINRDTTTALPTAE
ncbi:hypothetical protein [Rugamonas sp.]|uniref:tetratricopeptide repeat protein n=1 Tax=Rugamonas sp. TaxID=1926287 RepID=UPI0025E411B5|nr:hypothetical protein [Rugamonas sp.]